MNEIIINLNKVKNTVVAENRLGNVYLFALIARTDLEGKWDIIISGDKLKENNSEKDLTYVIEKIKTEFNNDLSFVSQIALLVGNENFIKDMGRALRKIGVTEGEVFNLKLKENYSIKQLYVLSSDFSKLDIDSTENTEKKVEVNSKNAKEF